MHRLLAVPALFCLAAAAPPMTFATEDTRFEAAAQDYRRIWAEDGARIMAAMENGTGLAFAEPAIRVIVFEGISSSGTGDRPMRLRASYTPEEKRGTLVHELGHRLIAALPRDPDLDEHRTLFLFLYDVWTDLYGRDFADRMVAVERRRRGVYDYDAAWTWALSMTREQRRSRLQALRR